MDFYQIKERSTKNGVIEIYPDFKVCRSKDLMVRGKAFYSIWDEDIGLWSTDEYDVQRIVDKTILEHKDKVSKRNEGTIQAKLMSNYSSKIWAEFRSYMNHLSDNAHQLDENLAFANTQIKKKDYVSKRLPYGLNDGPCPAWDEVISTLYDPEERAKLEWSIGAIVSGDAKNIQKFIVFYGDAGAGKSTVLNIIQKLFTGYYTTFDAKALTSTSNAFATEVFKMNPLVAIQHDGDLSKIEDNTKLNSIVSHEEMSMNEKYKPSYTSRINAFLYMATNKPVKITDAKSGIIRRLIDVAPSGRRLPSRHYQALITQIDFELGQIANHCLETYKKMGKNYYADYKPLNMIFQTDVFFNFVEDHYHVFKEENGVTLSKAYDIYKTYCDDTLITYKLTKYKFREELKNYFEKFEKITRVDNKQVRNYYSGFLINKFVSSEHIEEEHQSPLVLDKQESIFDKLHSETPAQYSSNGIPMKKWEEVHTTLSELDTSREHYVSLPINHIVIDFDLKNSAGEKSLELNMTAASKFPPTYAEISKGGNGVHLHYNYDGDPEMLSKIYDDEIEIKVFKGNSALRRKLTKCNNNEVASISSGLPLKGEKMLDIEVVKNEKMLRALLKKNLNKEIHPSTKSSIDFMYKLLEDAYNSGIPYDVTQMRNEILAFAVNSTNQSDYCIKRVRDMYFKSDTLPGSMINEAYEEDEIIFLDVEIYPNLFIICWESLSSDTTVTMINPTSAEVEELLKFKIAGFNCRRYDNHILYGSYIGYTQDSLYKLSQAIIGNSRNATFAEAYGLSYIDIYEMATKKQSLKKWQVELGLTHVEMDLPWDQPVKEELWPKIASYCVNDVKATKAVFLHLKEDYIARQIIAELSGRPVNDTTQNHAAAIIFGKDRNPQKEFVYTDLSIEFPGYKYERGKSTYRGEAISEGGQVFSKPGMYGNVGLFDIASQHPTTGKILNIFGKYTQNYVMLTDSRLAIKHKEIDEGVSILADIIGRVRNISKKEAVSMIYAILDKYKIDIVKLAYALKIVINIVYGMTSAKFDNPFKDPRNKDNIMAKRGALFMVDLRHAVEEQGYNVIHIKTDSIKVADADDFIANFIFEFGMKYGYTFEHEATYEKLCIVNDAVYIAQDKKDLSWHATGAQFAHPYVFKRLFSDEKIEFDDLCEIKSVSTKLFLDMNESLLPHDYVELEKRHSKLIKKYEKSVELEPNEVKMIEKELYEISEILDAAHNLHFIGKVGKFAPIKPGRGGGLLLREKDGNYYKANGSGDYRWLEASMILELGKEKDIDTQYHEGLATKAIEAIEKHGDNAWFRSNELYTKDDNGIWPF